MTQASTSLMARFVAAVRCRRSMARALVAASAWLLIGVACTWCEACIECVINLRYPIRYNTYRDGILGREVGQFAILPFVDARVASGHPETPPPWPAYLGGREVQAAQERYASGMSGPVASVLDGWQARWASIYVSSTGNQPVMEDGSPIWTDVTALRYGWPLRCWSAWHLELRASPTARPLPGLLRLGFEHDNQQPLLGIPAGWYTTGPDAWPANAPIRPRLLPVIPTVHLLIPSASVHAGLAWLVIRGPWVFRRWRRRRAGRCERCGYDRAGLPDQSTHCPECGGPAPGPPPARVGKDCAPSSPADPARAPAGSGE